MTQDLQNKILTIAKYDGWKQQKDPDWLWCRNNEMDTETSFKYLTDLNLLHPLTMKMLDELCEIRQLESIHHRTVIVMSCSNKPIQGEYIDLFNAVHEAIVFLNQQKEGK